MLIKTSKTSGHIDKRVECEKCGSRYFYCLARTRRAISILPLILRGPLNPSSGSAGESGDEESNISANKKLRDALLKGAEPVPCPECGWYQKDMVRQYQRRQLRWIQWVALSMLLASQAAAYWLMAFDKNRSFGSFGTGPGRKVQSWLICVGLAAIFALAAISLRWLLALGCNPNQGFPEKRAPVPGAPPAVREADFNDELVSATARITARRPIRVETRVLPHRRLPPPD